MKNFNLCLMDSIGDVFYSLPSLSVIKKENPDSPINLFVPWSTKTGSYKILDKYKGKLFNNYYLFAPNLSKISSDGHCYLEPDGQTYWLTNYMEDSYRMSLEKQNLQHHQIFARCLLGRDLTKEEEKFEFEIPQVNLNWAKKLTEGKKKFAIFNYHSKYDPKNISNELLVNIINYLTEEQGFDTVYMIGDELAPKFQETEKVKFLIGEDLYNILALSKLSNLSIALETGIMSVIGWLGTPTISFRQCITGSYPLCHPVNSRFICFDKAEGKTLKDIQWKDIKLGLYEFLKINGII